MASQWLISKLNTRRQKTKKKIGTSKKKYGRHITPNFKNENLCPVFLRFFGHFLAVFLICRAFPQKIDPKCLTWLESSGNKLSHHTFPKFIPGTIKCPEFCDCRGNQLCTIAQSVYIELYYLTRWKRQWAGIPISTSQILVTSNMKKMLLFFYEFSQ